MDLFFFLLSIFCITLNHIPTPPVTMSLTTTSKRLPMSGCPIEALVHLESIAREQGCTDVSCVREDEAVVRRLVAPDAEVARQVYNALDEWWIAGGFK